MYRKNALSSKKDVLSRKQIFLIFLVVVAIFGIGRLYHKKMLSEDYYHLESRLENVKSLDLSKKPEYESIGWLRVQGTSLDMPVIYSPSADYAYSSDFDNFTWISGKSTEFHKLIVIKGHNIMNLSAQPQLESDMFRRFEALMSFVYYDFAKDNKYIQLTLGEKEYIYKIFAVELVPASDTAYFPYQENPDEGRMKNYIDYMKKNSFYSYDVDVDKTDNILSLVTCTRFFGLENKVSFYVTGRLLRENEQIDNYVVKKTNNYRLIEETLKGDENNEENV